MPAAPVAERVGPPGAGLVVARVAPVVVLVAAGVVARVVVVDGLEVAALAVPVAFVAEVAAEASVAGCTPGSAGAGFLKTFASVAASDSTEISTAATFPSPPTRIIVGISEIP